MAFIARAIGILLLLLVVPLALICIAIGQLIEWGRAVVALFSFKEG